MHLKVLEMAVLSTSLNKNFLKFIGSLKVAWFLKNWLTYFWLSMANNNVLHNKRSRKAFLCFIITKFISSPYLRQRQMARFAQNKFKINLNTIQSSKKAIKWSQWIKFKTSLFFMCTRRDECKFLIAKFSRCRPIYN